MKNNKKRTYKLSDGGKLVSFVVLISILFTLQLSNKTQRVAIQEEMVVLQSDLNELKCEQKETRDLIGSVLEYTAKMFEPVSELKEFREVYSRTIQ